MPTYDYECPKCGHFEVQQSMKEDALKTCPKHPDQEVKRLISRNANFSLKGGGWYADGYGSGGGSGSSSSDSSSSD
ncbi:MAG: zinc ribbon domain-containing protein [Chrysiogenetes bacterium]|nr:zinc ribbon domain-containing protein [Chrysiogenetes bacterium]